MARIIYLLTPESLETCRCLSKSMSLVCRIALQFIINLVISYLTFAEILIFLFLSQFSHFLFDICRNINFSFPFSIFSFFKKRLLRILRHVDKFFKSISSSSISCAPLYHYSAVFRCESKRRPKSQYYSEGCSFSLSW
jgi:hypothetical protein